MSEKINSSLLHQQWIHAHEEDTATEMVFRSAGTPLPPARGRDGFELRADKTASHIGIGPTDASEESPGAWELDENSPPRLQISLATGEKQSLQVVSLDSDRLVVRKEEV